MPSPRSIRARQRFMASRRRSYGLCDGAARVVLVRSGGGAGTCLEVYREVPRRLEQRGLYRRVVPKLRGPGLRAAVHIYRAGRN